MGSEPENRTMEPLLANANELFVVLVSVHSDSNTNTVKLEKKPTSRDGQSFTFQMKNKQIQTHTRIK